MAAMMSVLARLTALEAEVASLREVQPLESFTASLKAATPEEIQTWMDVCREVAGDMETNPKVKKGKVTNETGPAEWNVFKNAVWREMAATNGIVCEDPAEFKKAVSSHGKDSGFSYQEAMKEASRRKAELEGKVKVAKVKAPSTLAAVQAKVAAAKAAPKVAKPAVPAAAVAPKVKPAAPVEPSELDLQLAAAADMGWVVVEHEGETFFHDPNGDLAFSYPDGDEQIGTYVPATAFAEAEFVRSE